MPTTVLWCHELFQESTSESNDKGGTEVWGYQVRLSNRDMVGPRLARAAVYSTYGVQRGYVHPDDPTMFVRSVSAKLENGSDDVFRVLATFTTPDESDGGGGDPNEEEDPLLRDPEVSWSSEKRSEPVWKDVNDVVIASSAG